MDLNKHIHNSKRPIEKYSKKSNLRIKLKRDELKMIEISRDDLSSSLSKHLDLTELEIDNRRIQYGYFNQY